MNFPVPPCIKIVLAEDQTLPEKPFLKTARANYTFIYPDGSSSKPTTVDSIVRRSMDAVCILAYFVKDDEIRVYLRSCLRATVGVRDYTPTGVLETVDVGNMWELPAGLIDSHEVGPQGVLEAGARELYEELGFSIEPNQLHFLGKRTYSSGGGCPERIFFLVTMVDPATRKEPTLDGSAFEAFGEVIDVSLKDALEAVDSGELYDAKTEIALTRFAKTI